VSVPVGLGEANRPVQVTIEPAREATNGAADYEAGDHGAADYGRWLDGLAGRWRGEFVRGNEGDFEIREPLS
jgi:hypothetical protein